jgi:hypothetical protein
VTEAVMSFSSVRVPQNCQFSKSSYRKIKSHEKISYRSTCRKACLSISNKHSAMLHLTDLIKMNNSRRSGSAKDAKENPFEWNISSSSAVNISSSAKADILEIQRQHANKKPTEDEFKFSEPRVSVNHKSLK